MCEPEALTLRVYFRDIGHDFPSNYDPFVLRWA